MLDKKLAEAARGRQQNFLVMSLVGLIVLMGGALAFVLAGNSWLISKPENTILISKQTVLKKRPKVVELPVRSPSPKVVSQSADKVDDTKLRKIAVELLGRYEVEFETFVTNDGFRAWNEKAPSSMTSLKEAAINEIATGNIKNAITNLEELLVNSSNFVTEFEQVFSEQFIAARTAYEADQYEDARLAISRALTLKGDDEESRALQKRISKLPKLLDLKEAAKVANIENNLQKEKQLLQEILIQDPTRLEYEARVSEIEMILTEREFEQAVSSGLLAASQENFPDLKKALLRARNIYPLRSEIRSLESKLTDLKMKIAITGFSQKAENAIKADQWKIAHAAFEKAAALDPSDGDVLRGLDMSTKIIVHQALISEYLDAPNRLSSPEISRAAQKAINDADLYGALSPSLNKQLSTLTEQITLRNKPVQVTVVSDNLTHIFVRGVGQVGKILKYQIELKPGIYLFEGRREGFKAKIVTIQIKTTDKAIQVKVISDEPV
ncbi:hypothetical protein A9Q83_16570 [Alphaproteobacteria bacterium 46_93_T64]|nr:hypothetical protein A9Q83_16570 [Alphaproteobacteria bacterium 46_93_T64]